MISESQVKSYWKYGFLRVPGLFSKQECEKIVSICKAEAREDFQATPNIDRKNIEVEQFVNDPRIEEVVRILHCGSPIDYLSTTAIFRQAGTPYAKQGFNLHQDSFFMGNDWHMGTSPIVILEEHNPRTGGIFVYPESHYEPILPHERLPGFDPNSKSAGSRLTLPGKYRDLETDLYLDPGDLYIQHGYLIHGSHSNVSPDKSRTVLAISCIVRGSKYSNEGGHSNRVPRPLGPQTK